MNTTVQAHIESRRLEEIPAEDEEVVGFWQKALRAYTDTQQSVTSEDNRLIRAYDAGRLAATAIMRSAGYRIKGAESHHFVTFEVAQSLVSDRQLRSAFHMFSGLRQSRHKVEYDYHDTVNAASTANMIELAGKTLELVGKHLREARPSLGPHLKTPPREP